MGNNKTPFEQYSDEPVFNIQAVAEQTDVPALTLRAWERRYDVPKPNRDSQGHRLYSERDIMVIKWLKRQVDSSMRIKQAVKLLHSQKPQHLTSSLAPAPGIHVLEEALGNRYDSLVDELFTAIKGFDYTRAQMILTHALSIYSIEDVCLGILIPTFALIDSAYQENEITLQIEHFGSNLIRARLLGILTTPATHSRSGRVVVGCAPHEWHEIGPLMFSLFLRRRGWEVIYLGQNVGFTGLRETITELRPDVFTLSITHMPNIRYLAEAAEITAESTNHRGIFTYAGQVFHKLPQMIDKFPGVYLGDDLVKAVETVEQLLNQRWRTPPYEPPVLPEGMTAALRYVCQQRGTIEGAASAILNDILGDNIEAETTNLALDVISTLTIALQYNDPRTLMLLRAQDNATLSTYGMDVKRLPEFAEALSDYFSHEAPAGAAGVISDFLMNLKPPQ
ncbi:MAG: MerR family transcriptional regulator [Chloroflexi bacterium]|nr:MerR family transcriptional regulator [Chloroflexota bacterium]